MSVIVKGRFDALDERFCRVDGHLERVEGHLAQVDTRLDNLDARLGQVENRISTLDDTFDGTRTAIVGLLGCVYTELTGRVSDLEAPTPRVADRA